MVRFFPEVVEMLETMDPGPLVADGELVLVRDGTFVFEELQLRLHPAESRVRKLAAEIPATLILFDLLEEAGEDLRERPLAERRIRLEALAGRLGVERVPERSSELPPGPETRLTPWTDDLAVAERWFADVDGLGQDGIVAKRIDQPYQAGVRGWIKVKHRSTADCVVARLSHRRRTAKGSARSCSGSTTPTGTCTTSVTRRRSRPPSGASCARPWRRSRAAWDSAAT